MVLSGRRSRRIGTQAWIVVAIGVTLLVLLVDASIKSRSPGPVKTLSSQAWVDQAQPILGETISQGDEINQLLTEPVATSARTILPELQGVVANATQTVASAQALKPPATIEGPSGLLIICLETRLEGAQTLSAAMSAALTTTGGNNALTQIQKATTEFQVADQAYSLFLQHMPPVGVQLPTSVWLSNPGVYATAPLSLYLDALRNARSPLPVHQLQVEAIATLPPAVSVEGSGANQVEILPQAATINVSATVGNLGNLTENEVRVTASLDPSVTGYLGSQSVLISSLAQGQSYDAAVPQLEAPQGVKVTLTVTVSPAAGQTDVSGTTKSIVFLMPNPNAPPTSTTTTVAPPSTTAPATGNSGTSGTTTTTASSTTSTSG